MDRPNTSGITLAAFAQKYIDFFENVWGRDERAKYYLFDDMDFPRNCYSFGFEMDCGHSFIEAMGEDLWNSPRGLDGRIHETDDIKLIGSAIFSKWRYFNHWSYSGPTEEDVEWFLVMFRRLRELC